MRLGVATILAGALILACKGTGEIEAGADVHGHHTGVSVRWRNVDENQKEIEMVATPHDVRVDIVFRDADGNEIPNSGAQGVAPGGTVPVPPGTVAATISGPSNTSPCAGCSGGGESVPGSAGGRSPANLTAIPASTVHYFSHGVPITAAMSVEDVGALSNTLWSIQFTDSAGLTPADIYERVAPIVEAPALGTPAMPANMIVESLVKMLPNPGGNGALLVCKDQSSAPFLEFDMDWNEADYADLTWNSQQYALAGSWHAVSIDIPALDFRLIGEDGSFNQLSLVTRTVEDPQPVRVDAFAQYF